MHVTSAAYSVLFSCLFCSTPHTAAAGRAPSLPLRSLRNAPARSASALRSAICGASAAGERGAAGGARERGEQRAARLNTQPVAGAMEREQRAPAPAWACPWSSGPGGSPTAPCPQVSPWAATALGRARRCARRRGTAAAAPALRADAVCLKVFDARKLNWKEFDGRRVMPSFQKRIGVSSSKSDSA